MPLVRLDVPAAMAEADRARAGEVVHDALRSTLDVPDHDHFQVIAAHAPGGLVIDRTYLGIERTGKAVIVQVFLNEGRDVEKKKRFYKAVADGLHERIGLRREDVIIQLIETTKENWSFGNGEAQYA